MVTRRFAASVVVGMLSTLLLVAVAPTAVADSLSTVNRAVLPPGALAKNQSATLNAVSCAAVNTCTAVGAYRTSNGPAPLVSTEVGGVWQSPTTVVLPPR